jgi:hypothetical protein
MRENDGLPRASRNHCPRFLCMVEGTQGHCGEGCGGGCTDRASAVAHGFLGGLAGRKWPGWSISLKSVHPVVQGPSQPPSGGRSPCRRFCSGVGMVASPFVRWCG